MNTGGTGTAGLEVTVGSCKALPQCRETSSGGTLQTKWAHCTAGFVKMVTGNNTNTWTQKCSRIPILVTPFFRKMFSGCRTINLGISTRTSRFLFAQLLILIQQIQLAFERTIGTESVTWNYRSLLVNAFFSTSASLIPIKNLYICKSSILLFECPSTFLYLITNLYLLYAFLTCVFL